MIAAKRGKREVTTTEISTLAHNLRDIAAKLNCALLDIADGELRLDAAYIAKKADSLANKFGDTRPPSSTGQFGEALKYFDQWFDHGKRRPRSRRR